MRCCRAQLSVARLTLAACHRSRQRQIQSGSVTRIFVDDLMGIDGVTPFDANKGTPMKEWLSLEPASKLDWLVLARAALEFAQVAAPGKGHR